MEKPVPTMVASSRCQFHRVDQESLAQYLYCHLQHVHYDGHDIDNLINKFDELVIHFLDKHPPLKSPGSGIFSK